MNQNPSNDDDTSLKPRSLHRSVWHRWFRQRWVWGLILVVVATPIFFLFFSSVLPHLRDLYELLITRERISEFVKSFGSAAPLVFMAMQFMQVILAPIPGEATGFIGGYLFGIVGGTIYSTIALTLGSYVNFLIGRLLGKKWVRKTIPSVALAKMDYLLRHQALYIVFFLFLFPGFPKDYLCLFLGISNMPMRVFLLMALIGRFPGTLMLNIQGALVFEKNYLILFVMVIFNVIILVLVYRYRSRLYRWIEKINDDSQDKIDAPLK